jgi:hypothetical protein
MAAIIERIDLGCGSNPMQVLISLTAPSGEGLATIEYD